MDFEKEILNFHKQFDFKPEIFNQGNLKKFKKFIVVGMGGSHLSADIIKNWNQSLELIVRRDYKLPKLSEEEMKKRLVILSSFSGNTEETISAFYEAVRNKIPAAVVSTDGNLLKLAKKWKVPYIQFPNQGIQPRMAIGLSLKSILKLMGEEKALSELSKISSTLKPLRYKKKGREISQEIKGFIPIVYSSGNYSSLSYIWKIKFNEGCKIPAFSNLFPELNHNEMTGFRVENNKIGGVKITKIFYFIFLRDKKDNSRILKRMDILSDMLKQNGFLVRIIDLEGKNFWEKIFNSITLIDWITLFLAKKEKVDPDNIPLIESFKKKMKE